VNRFEAEDYIAKRFFELDEAFKNFLKTIDSLINDDLIPKREKSILEKLRIAFTEGCMIYINALLYPERLEEEIKDYKELSKEAYALGDPSTGKLFEELAKQREILLKR